MKGITQKILRTAACTLPLLLAVACAAEAPAGNPLSGPWEYALGRSGDGIENAAGYRYGPAGDISRLERLVPGGQGVIWLRKKFAAPAGFRERRLAVILGTIIPVDETYLNGAFIGGYGVSPETGRPFFSDWNRYRLYGAPSALFREGDNSLHVKIYANHEASINGYVALDDRSVIEGVYRAQDFIRYHLNLVVAFVLFCVAIFLLIVIFLQRPRARYNLYLAGTCILFAFYILNFFIARLPLDPGRLPSYLMIQKIAYGAPCVSFFFLVMYIHRFLDIRQGRALAALNYFATLMPAFLLVLMPSYPLMVWYGKHILSACAGITILYILFLSIVSVVRRNRNALIFLAGFTPVIASVAFDIVVHVGLGRNDIIYLSGIGISSYLIFIAMMLATNFVSYYRQVERLNADLGGKIAEQKMTEDELMAEKELLAVTIESIAEAVVATDRAGNVLILNRVAEELCRATPEELVGKPVHQELACRNEAVASIFSEVFEEMGDADRTLEIGLHRLERSDGEKMYIVGSCAPIRDREQHAVGSVFVLRDVTGDIKLQNEILKIKKLESLGVLAGGIAHDFNNILTAILGSINLAKMILAEQPEPERLMVDAEKAVLRAQGLTRQLLTFAKGGAPVKQVASVQEIIRDSTDFVLRGSNVRCSFDFTEGLWSVNVDVGQFSQVIQNLVINADQSMPDGGEIVIRTENITIAAGSTVPLKPGNYVKISVIDAGGGIDPQSLPRIFDPYFTTKKDGSGLGLASSYSIIKKHDGHIEAESTPGRGSAFHIYLPSSGQSATADRRADASVARIGGTALLMDDDPGVGITVRKMLEHLGMSVVVTQNGEGAIDLYRRSHEMGKPFDLVILDLTIPGGIGGREVIRELLAIDPGVSAIVSSGYSTDRVMAEYAKYGFRGVISKPYRLEELSEAIRRIKATDAGDGAKK